MQYPAVHAQNLTKHYTRVRAVDGLNLRVPQGAVYGFLGRNGAGKTTTIKMLMGLTRPTGGTVRVLGGEWQKDRLAILRRVAFVDESKLLYGSLTAIQLMAFNRSFYHTWSDDAAKRYAALLEVPLDQPLRKLSQGNRTKVALLLALAQGAELLVLDEPTTGLDPVSVAALLHILTDQNRSEGRSIFFSSHQLSEVEQIAGWVGIVNDGKLLIEAPSERIREDFRLVEAVVSAAPDPPQGAEVISARRTDNRWRFVVGRHADRFAEQLRSAGAIVEVSSLDLRELFLELVGKRQEQCTRGNAGSTPARVL